MSAPPTFIYVIEARGGFIKIGCSERPTDRLAIIRTHSPLPTRLLAVWPGHQAAERALHDRFAAQRSHGEWFRVEDAALLFVAEVAGRGLAAIETWDHLTFPTHAEKKALKAAKQSAALKANWANPEWRRDKAVSKEWQRIVSPFRRPDGSLPRWFTTEIHDAVQREALTRFQVAGPRQPGSSAIECRLRELSTPTPEVAA